MKTISIFNNKNGSALISVLVASGLTAMIALGSMTLVENSYKKAESHKSSIGKLSLQQDISAIMGNFNVCGTQVKIKNIAEMMSTGSSEISVMIGNQEIGSNNPSAAIQLYDLKNVKMTLTNMTQTNTEPYTGNKIYSGQLILSSERKNNNAIGGAALQNVNLGLFHAVITNANTLASCGSQLQTALNPADVCYQMGGIFNLANETCTVGPRCPAGQIMVSNGVGVAGSCQEIPTKTVYVTEPAPAPQIVEKEVFVDRPVVQTQVVEKEVIKEVFVDRPVVQTQVIEKIVIVDPPPPKPGEETGNAYCIEYPPSHTTCSQGGCGNPNSLNCPSTWRFHGTAVPGGCKPGSKQTDKLYSFLRPGDVVGYFCRQK